MICMLFWLVIKILCWAAVSTPSGTSQILYCLVSHTLVCHPKILIYRVTQRNLSNCVFVSRFIKGGFYFNLLAFFWPWASPFLWYQLLDEIIKTTEKYAIWKILFWTSYGAALPMLPRLDDHCSQKYIFCKQWIYCNFSIKRDIRH